jgi:hypothetical protein
MAPVVEAVGALMMLGLLATGVLDVPLAILFLLLAYGWGTALSLFAIAVDEFAARSYSGLRDRLLLFGEAFGYRQLTTVWRLRGLWRALRGRTDWGAMTRSGFSRGQLQDGG